MLTKGPLWNQVSLIIIYISAEGPSVTEGSITSMTVEQIKDCKKGCMKLGKGAYGKVYKGIFSKHKV